GLEVEGGGTGDLWLWPKRPAQHHSYAPAQRSGRCTGLLLEDRGCARSSPRAGPLPDASLLQERPRPATRLLATVAGRLPSGFRVSASVMVCRRCVRGAPVRRRSPVLGGDG